MPTMNRQIFNIGLTTEGTSLYLLLCGLNDEGASLTTNTVLSVWTGTREAFGKALEELEGRNIVAKRLSDPEGQDVYQVVDAGKWK